MESQLSSQRWWGTFELPEGEARRWRVGPVTLWIQRLRGEWRVLHEHADDPLATPLEVAIGPIVVSSAIGSPSLYAAINLAAPSTKASYSDACT